MSIEQYGYPEIFSTDQGSQFTRDELKQVLKENDIRISMDGKGRWVDNVFVELLWRSVKHERSTWKSTIPSLGRYFDFSNTKLQLQSFGKQTFDSVYIQLADRMAA